MSLKKILFDAIDAAKDTVLDNLDQASKKTGKENPFGDKTLLLDQQAENAAIEILQSSEFGMKILTEEQGTIESDIQTDYLIIIDPIDGSANLERRIPLCTIGISAIPIESSLTTDNVEISIIDSYFTKETYVAQRNKGVTCNGERVKVADSLSIEDTIISYDSKKKGDPSFALSSQRVIEGVKDIRRTASNLLDLCWVAAGKLDAMVDLRNMLPIIHVSGTHMVREAGGFILSENKERFVLPLESKYMMSFVAASNEQLAQQILQLYHSE
ncbi:MAG: Inositol-1-monophosphatase [Candidatus Thorarchaeota archaeon]|nr:MAG: Inositol-1-monophosphatase [Candidatus Thorarchaeota archaeon]